MLKNVTRRAHATYHSDAGNAAPRGGHAAIMPLCDRSKHIRHIYPTRLAVTSCDGGHAVPCFLAVPCGMNLILNPAAAPRCTG
ncbi:hypothetical protein SXCC_02892 [Gluconacetobacter sp. SXCC-1]|nr:hypothetical protein SXCC_02892 [Gluconacetobacter sp. SXCC-1]